MPSIFRDKVTATNITTGDQLDMQNSTVITDVLTGWNDTSALDTIIIPRGGGDGARSGGPWLSKEKYMVLGGAVYGLGSRDRSEMMRNQIYGVFTPNTIIALDREVGAVTQRMFVCVYDKINSEDPVEDGFRFTIPIVALDPFKYSASVVEIAAGVFTGDEWYRVYEDAQPSVVAATNLLSNGGFNAGVDGWNPNLAPVITWNAGTLEASGNGTSSGLSAITTATAWGVTAGQTVYARARVRSVSGQTPTGTVARFGFGATNVSVDPVGWAPGSDGWVDLRFSAVVPSDVTAATACRVNVGARLAANAQVSDRIQIDDVIVSTVDTPFFDGDTPDTNTVSYSWTGTAPTNVPGSWTNGSFSNNVAGWSAYQGAAAPVWRAGGFLTSPGNNTATSNYVVSDPFDANFQSGQVLTMRPRFKLEGGKAFTVFVCRILLGSTIVGSGDRTLANLGVSPDAEGFYNPGIPITIGAGVTPGAQVRIVVGVAGLPSNATASDLFVMDTVAGTVETAGSPSEKVILPTSVHRWYDDELARTYVQPPPGALPTAATIVNEGNAVSRRLKINVYGPLAQGDWSIFNETTGESFYLDFSIPEGRMVSVDMYEETVFLEQNDLTSLTYGSWITLVPGINTLRLMCGTRGSTAYMEIQSYSSWR